MGCWIRLLDKNIVNLLAKGSKAKTVQISTRKSGTIPYQTIYNYQYRLKIAKKTIYNDKSQIWDFASSINLS